MTRPSKPPEDIVLEHLTSPYGKRKTRLGSRAKCPWRVAHSPKSSGLQYALVLYNLTGHEAQPEGATIESVRSTLEAGLSRDAFERLKLITDTSSEELGRTIRIPQRTLSRRVTFKPDESERILRVASVFQKTLEVLGALPEARRWFASPKQALGGRTPLEFCDSEPGAREVEHLLGRIEHGVFT